MPAPIGHRRGDHSDLIGRRFGNVLVVAQHAPSLIELTCDCGTRRMMPPGDVRAGRQTSCSRFCRLSIEAAAARRLIHGDSFRAGTTREYRIWCAMRTRCSNSNIPHYANYGGRGIRVCRRWGKYENFLADMGRAPSNLHSIDRINNEGNYTMKNCRWATPKEQGRNKRGTIMVRIDGAVTSLAEACETTGVRYLTAWKRINRGIPDAQAVRP
jgi:hypothetical protein